MVKKLKNKLLTSIKNGKFNVFLLFFVIATVVLFLSKLSKTQTQTFAFKITGFNAPEEFVLLNKDSLYLDITLKADGFKLLKFYLGPPNLKVNFEALSKLNDTTFIWNRNSGFSLLSQQLNRGEEVLSISPDTLYFNYDINHRTKIPVRLKSKIGFAQGYDLEKGFVLTPDSVVVIGPKSLVSNWHYVETDTLIMNNVNANISRKVRLKIPKDFQSLKVLERFVEVHGQVDRFTEGSVKVPVNIKNIPNGITLHTFPKEITVTYYTSLSNYNEISAEDFKVECDYSLVNKDRSYLEPILTKKPEKIKSARINQNRVEFILSE